MLSTGFEGVTASASITAAGGISLAADSTNGNAVTQVSWLYPASTGLVTVLETYPGSTYTFNGAYATAASPVNLPDSGASNAYPAGSGSIYTVSTQVQSNTTSITNGAFAAGCTFESLDSWNQSVTLP